MNQENNNQNNFQTEDAHHRTEPELKTAREKADIMNANIQAIIENTPDSIWAINPNYELIYINGVFKREFFHSFGIQLETGMNLLYSLPEILRPLWKSGYDRALNNEHFIFEDKVDTGKSFVYVQVAMNPIVSNGKVIGASFFGSNITERKLFELQLIENKEKLQAKNHDYESINEELKQTNEELLIAKELAEENENKFRNILNNTKFHLWAFDGLKYHFVNKNWYDFSGQPLDAQLNIQTWISTVHPDDIEKSTQILIKNLSTKTEHYNYFRLRRYDGVYRDFFCHAVPIFDDDNNFMYFQGYNIDITEQKRAESELLIAKERAEKNEIDLLIKNDELRQLNDELMLAREKADESDRLKTSFLNNISHEVRTPMNSIIGFSQLIVSGKTSSGKLEHFSKIINENCDQLLDIITNIIEISQLQNKQIKVVERELNVETIYQELKYLYTNKCTEKKIALVFSCKSSHFENNTISDYYKLLRIFKLLIDNAIKFTLDGKIEISCEMTANGFFEFAISDTGIGISPEMQQKVFEPFRQVETGISRNFGGNGVGLSISKAYIELLGGQIWLKSQTNEGTTVYFTIPYKPTEKQNQQNIIQPNAIDLSDYTVLIAEDEYSNYLLIERYLSHTNIKILYATNGLQAIDFCRNNNKIDLVLMDIKMPEMDGHSATRLIKNFRPELTIIAQTAYALQHEKEFFLENGFDDYLCKPIKEDLLIETIQKHINKLINN